MKKIICLFVSVIMAFALTGCGIDAVAIDKVEMNGYTMSPLGQYTCLDIENYESAIKKNDQINIGYAGSAALAEVKSPRDYYTDGCSNRAFEECTKRICIYPDKSRMGTPLTYSTGIELND